MTSVTVFAITSFAAALSTMSGGGSSAINIPLFLALGMPFPLAIATHQVSATAWLSVAAYNYLKIGRIQWKFIGLFTVLGLIGLSLGMFVVITVDQRILEIIVGCIILLLVSYTYFRKGLGVKREHSKPKRAGLIYLAAPVMGFYVTAFGGAGSGVFFSLATLKTRGFDFITALGHFYVIALVWIMIAAGILIFRGFYVIEIMVPAIAGSILGGYFGSRYAKTRGNRFVKMMFVAVGGVLGLKMLLGW